MPGYIVLMHDDARDVAGDREVCPGRLRTSGAVPAVTAPVTGFIPVQPDGMQAAQMPVWNPVFEAGGTVKLREPPVSV